jgi:hypothetical protein
MNIINLKIVILFISIVIFATACENMKYFGHKHELQEWERKVDFDQVDEIAFPTDSSVTNRGLALQSFIAQESYGVFQKGREYLSYYNNPGNNIVFYDYDLRKVVHRTQLLSQGPHSVGSNTNYIHVLKDDLVLVTSPVDEMIYLVNFSGEVIEKFSSALLDFPNGQILLTNKLVLNQFDNHLFVPLVSGLLAPQDISKAINQGHFEGTTVKIDLETKKLSILGEYSDSYTQGIYSRYEYKPYQTLDSNGQLFYSFPIDEFIYDVNGNEYYAGSDYFKNSVPITNSGKFKDNSDLEYEYHRLQNSFDIIRYDPFEKVFYRVVNLAKTIEELDLPEPLYSRYKNKSIIVLDSNLVKIGETLLPEYTYSEQLTFSNKYGFHMVNFKKTFEVEDSIFFGVFKPMRTK